MIPSYGLNQWACLYTQDPEAELKEVIRRQSEEGPLRSVDRGKLK